jgi:hypothetical protein
VAGDVDAVVEHVTRRMQDYLPGDDLLFLAQLSVEPVRAKIAG